MNHFFVWISIALLVSVKLFYFYFSGSKNLPLCLLLHHGSVCKPCIHSAFYIETKCHVSDVPTQACKHYQTFLLTLIRMNKCGQSCCHGEVFCLFFCYSRFHLKCAVYLTHVAARQFLLFLFLHSKSIQKFLLFLIKHSPVMFLQQEMFNTKFYCYPVNYFSCSLYLQCH